MEVKPDSKDEKRKLFSMYWQYSTRQYKKIFAQANTEQLKKNLSSQDFSNIFSPVKCYHNMYIYPIVPKYISNQDFLQF